MMVAKPHHAVRALASGVVAGGVAAALYLIRREQREFADEAIAPHLVEALDVTPAPIAESVAESVVTAPPSVVDDGSVMARVAHLREIAAPPVEPARPAPEPEKTRRKVRFDWRLAFGMLAILAIAVPWFIPGFARSVDERLGSSHAVVDPPVLSTPGPTAAASASSIPGRLAANGVPIRVGVPRLQIDSAVIPISGASGALFPPNNPAVIGWWKEGPKPGDPTGTTLLTGHTVHTGGGAFDKLDALQAGDTFTVSTALGTITYQVTAVTKYTKGDLANVASQIFRIDGPPEVLLITCANWDGHEFLDNTVVTGVPVSETSPSTPPKVTAGGSRSASPSVRPSVRPSRFVQGVPSRSP